MKRDSACGRAGVGAEAETGGRGGGRGSEQGQRGPAAGAVRGRGGSGGGGPPRPARRQGGLRRRPPGAAEAAQLDCLDRLRFDQGLYTTCVASFFTEVRHGLCHEEPPELPAGLGAAMPLL